MGDSLALELLRGSWGEDAPLVERFLASAYFPLLAESLGALKRDRLYMSHVHGVGHVERVMVHGAMGARAEGLSEADARLLLTMCAYHDTGRICDYLDGAHGFRSAEKLAEISGLRGEDLKEAMAGVEAHSLGDGLLEGILAAHRPEDLPRARRLALLLKDADGLDRVRIQDLDVSYLRFPESRERARFAQLLFDRYTALEAARGLDKEGSGFTLAEVRRVKAFVRARLAEGKSCGETALLAWDALEGTSFGIPAGKEAGEGGTCALLEGALRWMDAALAAGGVKEKERSVLGGRFREKFRAQYGSDRCGDLRPGRGCGAFTVDGVLFARQFYLEETGDTERRW